MADAAPAPPTAEGDLPQNTQDLTLFVQQLLGQMVVRCVPAIFIQQFQLICAPLQQNRFQTMSDGIIGKIDEMGSRIDDLEKSIGDIMQQAGIEDEGEGDDEERKD